MEKQPPKSTNPIQSSNQDSNAFNVQKKPEIKDTTMATDNKNMDDTDGNKTQKVKNDLNSHLGIDSSATDQWKTKVNSAKQQWSKLQQEELIATCGNSDQLSSLVQKRYVMNKLDADKQVKEFFSKH